MELLVLESLGCNFERTNVSESANERGLNSVIEQLYSNYVLSHAQTNLVDPHAHFPALAFVTGPDNCNILDLGCGTGRVIQKLKSMGYFNIVGVDNDKNQIEVGTRAGIAEIQNDNAFDFLARQISESFDYVLLVDVLEHFSLPDAVLLGRSINRVLKPGGSVIVQTPNGSAPLNGVVAAGDLTHLQIYTPSSLNQWGHLTGFHITQVFEVKPPLGSFKRLVRRFIYGFYRINVKLLVASQTGLWKNQIVSMNMIAVFSKPESDLIE